MKLEAQGATLRVSGVREFGAATSNLLRDKVRAALADDQTTIEIDMSEATFIDSCGLGALIALHKTACARKGGLRLVNPQPAVQQILNLTRMNQLFNIVRL